MIGRLLPLRAKETLKPILIFGVLFLIYQVSGAEKWIEGNLVAESVLYAVGIVLVGAIAVVHFLMSRRSLRNLLIGLFFLFLALFWAFVLYSKLSGSN